MKKPILLILPVLLLLISFAPVKADRPPPGSSLSIKEDKMEGHPWEEIDSSPQLESGILTGIKSESAKSISNDNWIITIIKGLTKDSIASDLIIILKYNELVDGNIR